MTTNTTPKSIQDLKKMKIEEALELLENSAKEYKGEMKSLIADRYKSVESAFENIFGVSPEEIFEETKDKIKSASKQAQKFAKDKADEIDSNVHDNPWTYIGGGILLGGIVGFMLGRK